MSNLFFLFTSFKYDENKLQNTVICVCFIYDSLYILLCNSVGCNYYLWFPLYITIYNHVGCNLFHTLFNHMKLPLLMMNVITITKWGNEVIPESTMIKESIFQICNLNKKKTKTNTIRAPSSYSVYVRQTCSTNIIH